MSSHAQPELRAEEYKKLSALLHTWTGIRLQAKEHLMVSRLAPRLRERKLQRYRDYLQLLEEQGRDSPEAQAFINALTTNKTSFFREAHHFTFLVEQLFAEFRERARSGGSRRLRMYSAGCSRGAEPYTMALLAAAHLPAAQGWNVRILATDLDTDVLKEASQGLYPPEELDEVPPALRKRWFQREAQGMRVHPEAASLVTFKRANLIAQPFPVKGKFDVVFCRNVMIYFDRPTQEKLVEDLCRLIVPGGCLVIGHSEGLLGQHMERVPNVVGVYRPHGKAQRGRSLVPRARSLVPRARSLAPKAHPVSPKAERKKRSHAPKPRSVVPKARALAPKQPSIAPKARGRSHSAADDAVMHTSKARSISPKAHARSYATADDAVMHTSKARSISPKAHARSYATADDAAMHTSKARSISPNTRSRSHSGSDDAATRASKARSHEASHGARRGASNATRARKPSLRPRRSQRPHDANHENHDNPGTAHDARAEAASQQRRAKQPLPEFPQKRIVLGEWHTAKQPTVVSTLLGSCVAACLFDPVARIGGMNHFMLPSSDAEAGSAARFGIHAMEILINELMRKGADRKRLLAKAFGAAAVNRALTSDVAAKNGAFIREFLSRENIPLVAERLGGTEAREVYMRTDNGEAHVRRIAANQADKLAQSELDAWKRMSLPPPAAKPFNPDDALL